MGDLVIDEVMKLGDVFYVFLCMVYYGVLEIDSLIFLFGLCYLNVVDLFCKFIEILDKDYDLLLIFEFNILFCLLLNE